MSDMPWRSIRAVCQIIVRRKVDVVIEGKENLPTSGPVLIAARHFHHLYDGAAIVATVRRPVHPVVTVDWIKGSMGRRVMTFLCRSARWPAVVRTDPFTTRFTPYDPIANRPLFRRAVDDVSTLLNEGRIVLMFPEGYPNIDPNETPKTRDDELLPFQTGFVRFAQIAERTRGLNVPIVPAGLVYERGPKWKLTVRYGPAVPGSSGDVETLRLLVESKVAELSGLRG